MIINTDTYDFTRFIDNYSVRVKKDKKWFIVGYFAGKLILILDRDLNNSGGANKAPCSDPLKVFSKKEIEKIKIRIDQKKPNPKINSKYMAVICYRTLSTGTDMLESCCKPLWHKVGTKAVIEAKRLLTDNVDKVILYHKVPKTYDIYEIDIILGHGYEDIMATKSKIRALKNRGYKPFYKEIKS